MYFFFLLAVSSVSTPGTSTHSFRMQTLKIHTSYGALFPAICTSSSSGLSSRKRFSYVDQQFKWDAFFFTCSGSSLSDGYFTDLVSWYGPVIEPWPGITGLARKDPRSYFCSPNKVRKHKGRTLRSFVRVAFPQHDVPTSAHQSRDLPRQSVQQ